MMQELAVYLGSKQGGLVLCSAVIFLLLLMAFAALKRGKRNQVGALLLSFFFMELAVVFIILSFGFDVMEDIDSSPKLVPLMWSLLLFLFSLMQFLKIWYKTDYKPVKHGNLVKVGAVLAIVAVTVLVFKKIGFFFATGGMIILLMLLMGERRVIIISCTAVVWMFMTWLIFNKLLLMGLPMGSFFL